MADGIGPRSRWLIEEFKTLERHVTAVRIKD